jgi:hypothetical protein
MNDEYQCCIEQIRRLTEHRQHVTTTYLSVNTAITGAIAFLLINSEIAASAQSFAILLLLISGVVVSDLWRRLIYQYSTLLGWWYGQLRMLESLSSRDLFSKEYRDLYSPQSSSPTFGLTHYQVYLTWVFTVLYLLFGLGIVVGLFIQYFE